MKKIITLIVLAIFISSFYMVYEDFIQEKSYSLKNSEYELEDVKNVIVPSKLTSLPRGVQYKTLFESTKGGISLYFTRIEEAGEKEKIIKYIHINNDD
ncbi:MAG: bacteriocin-associated integral membrane family protein, partial [Clostridium sp.]